MSETEAEEQSEKLEYTFQIPKQFLWGEITKNVKALPEKLATAIGEIAKLNIELQGVINRVDFLEFARNQENRELLRQLVELFNKTHRTLRRPDMAINPTGKRFPSISGNIVALKGSLSRKLCRTPRCASGCLPPRTNNPALWVLQDDGRQQASDRSI